MRQTLGDVMKVNGFSRYAVIDDRGDHVKDEIQNLLQQIGSLVYWSDRVPWMERVARQRVPRSGARRTRRASHHRTRALADQRPLPRGRMFLTQDAHIRYRSAETTALHQAGLGASGHSSG